MYVDVNNIEDVKKYFLHTYVKFKEKGEKIFLIKEVSSIEIIAEDLQGEEISVDLQIGYTLDYLIPKKTIYQHGKNAILLTRIPARMWRKGMDSKNTKFFILGFSNKWHEIPFNMDIIEAYVKKANYFSFEEVLKYFSTPHNMLESAALSSRIAISKKGRLFLDDIQIGKYLKSKKQMVVKKIFYSDIKNLIPDIKYCIV